MFVLNILLRFLASTKKEVLERERETSVGQFWYYAKFYVSQRLTQVEFFV